MIEFTSQPSENRCEQVQDTGREQVTDATMIKRGDFATGEATVLVVDCFQHAWEQYSQRVPRQANLLFVPDTSSAVQAMRENPAIGVVFVQGLSRKTSNPEVDRLMQRANGQIAFYAWMKLCGQKGLPVNDWLDDYSHTLDFLKLLRQQKFGGLVQVVSTMLTHTEIDCLHDFEGLRVRYMSKQSFFSGTFTRKGGYVSSPAENRLYDRWEVALRLVRERTRLSSKAKSVAIGCEEALTYIEELKSTIKNGDVRKIYGHASQYPQQRGTCDCPSSDACHRMHELNNAAVWELLDNAGLMGWLELELELDLASKSSDFPGFGHHMRYDVARTLRSFFCASPAREEWFVRV